MLYLLKDNLKQKKPFFLSLSQIKKIGGFYRILTCKHLGFCLNIKTYQLSKIQISKIYKFIKSNSYSGTQKFISLKGSFLKTLRKITILNYGA